MQSMQTLKSGSEALLGDPSSLERLRNSQTRQELAQLIGYEPKSVSYIVNVADDAAKYREFHIPKKSGGLRKILAPNSQLKALQRKLARLLAISYSDFLYFKGRRRNPAHGFLQNRSICTNSSPHVRCDWVLNVDIEDFFGSINFGRVRGFFMSKEGFALSEPVATLIAQICCHQNSLPQGAPTSPIVSNLVATYLDNLLLRLAAKHRLRYTRYADDITFSLKKGDFPEEIAAYQNGKLVIGKSLEKVFKKSGFSINHKKSRLQSNGSRQTVTGLVTNSRVNVNSDFRKTVRAMVHRYTTQQVIAVDTPNGIHEYSGRSATSRLSGYLGFIDWVDSLQHKEGIRKTYKEFLLYTRFFDNTKPVILCEGETDVVYFKEAIKQLAAELPSLVEASEESMKLKVEFYNYRNRRMNELLGLGGCPQLKNLLDEMSKLTKKFHRSGNAQPVIIIVDADHEGEGVIKKFDSLKTRFGNFYKPDRFNVKVVKIASPLEKATVENLLPPELLEVQADGRQFTTEEDFDRSLFFGKKELAEKVFFPLRHKLDYSGFRETLKKVESSLHGT